MLRFINMAAIVALAGCTEARAATEPDSANSLHCGAAWSIYYGIATTELPHLVPLVKPRMTWQGLQASRLPEEKRTRAEGEAIQKLLVADPDRLAKFTTECGKREDADPSFQAFIGKS